MRKNDSLSYKQIKFSYSVYGKNNEYSARATITVHSGDHSTEIPLELGKNFKTLKEAEAEIIKAARNQIDSIKPDEST